MNTSYFEKIINESWNNKNQINSKSSKKLLNAINKTIEVCGKIKNQFLNQEDNIFKGYLESHIDNNFSLAKENQIFSFYQKKLIFSLNLPNV